MPSTAPYLPTLGLSNSGVIGYIKPPPSLPSPLGVAGALTGGLSIALAVTQVIGLLGGNRFRDDLLAKIPSREVNGGNREVSTPPPFRGGQSPVFYQIWISFVVSSTGERIAPFNALSALGPIREITPITSDLGNVGIKVTSASGVTSLRLNDFFYRDYQVEDIRRGDGLPDTGGDIPTPTINSPSGYTGSPPEQDRDKTVPPQPKIVPPSLSPAIGWGMGKPLDGRSALGIGSPTRQPQRTVGNTRVTSGISSGGETTSINTGLAPIGLTTSFTPPSPTQIPEAPTIPLKTPQEPAKEEPKKTPPFVPPIDPTPNDIWKQLTGLGAILALIGANTNPLQQVTNAKTGSCQALNDPSCRNGLKNDIVNPLSDKIDAKTASLAANQAGQDIALGTIITEQQIQKGVLGKILSFLDNSIVDRAIGVANFAMNAHNALMLSNNLGKTLATVVDTAMGLTPFRFTDATTGQNTTASRAFTSNVSALIINLIGQDLYTELSDDWKVANRIYQSSTNLLNKTQRMLGNQSKVQQKSGIDIANIGNALRANGIVNPNSYPPMAATKEANTPPEVLEDASTPLQNIQAGIKNLNTITKSVNGTLKQISGLKKDFGKIQNLMDKESKVRKSMRSASAAQAKRKAKFTLLQIKTIKQTGKK